MDKVKAVQWISVLVLVAILCAFVFAARITFGYPEVRISSETGKCVSVRYAGPGIDCGNLPRLYFKKIVR